MDRGKGSIKRSVAVDAKGISLGTVTAPVNRYDSPLLAGTLDVPEPLGDLPEGASVYLDRAYDSVATREILAGRRLFGEISRRDYPAPLRVGLRWVVERTNS